MTRHIAAFLGITAAALVALGTAVWLPTRYHDSEELSVTDEWSATSADRGSAYPSLTPSSFPTNAGLASGCDYWVDPEGSDAQAGTVGSPWRTLEHAAEAVPDSGCTVWFRPGLYRGYQQIKRRFTFLTTFRAVDPYQAVFESSSIVIDIDGARNVVIEGFEIRHSDPSADSYVVIVDQGDGLWAEGIAFRNNIIHDSYDNDLLKIHNGVRNAVVEGNLFYNQGPSEQHMDINSVTDVVVQDNVFFNDYASSSRSDGGSAKHFIMVKDSNEDADGLLGAQRITIRRNVFLNWEGGKEAFVKIGNDGKPYHEAAVVDVVNNLMIGNSSDEVNTAFGVAGARQVTFANNTVVGDLPARQYAFNLEIKGDNPANEGIFFFNNIWADPTGTMGDFSDGDIGGTNGLGLSNNLYWNNGSGISPGDLVDPLSIDQRALLGDPRLPTDQADVVLPRWLGSAFPSGNTTIRDEFVRLVTSYGMPAGSSAALDRSHPSWTPADDILGRWRGLASDVGAYEVDPIPGTALCPSIGTTFIDIAPGRYYSQAVRWLACEGITTGTSPATYAPHDPLTRAPMATFLWRFEERPHAASLTRFSDVSPGRYYTEAVAWLDETVITTGTSPTTFSPHDCVTRAEMATFLWRLVGQPQPSSNPTPFNDVPAETYSTVAVVWLSESGITTGTSPTTFSPDDCVTRAQMATFLWRLAGGPVI